MSVGSNIKKYRKAKKLSQSEFEQIGISQSFISLLEAEKTQVSVEIVLKIAEFLGISILDLIDLPITHNNFLTVLNSIDAAFNLDILEVRTSNGSGKYGIFINDESIQKKLQLYKLMRELNKSPESPDKELFRDMLNSPK